VTRFILFNALRAKGVTATRYVLTGAGHGDLTVPGMSATNALPWSTRADHELHRQLPEQEAR
jgi:hypothetical protein